MKKRKLNIAMIGQKRIPSREGGVEVAVEELSTRLVKTGCDVTCFNRSGHNIYGKEFDAQQLDEYKGVKIKTVFTIERKGLAAFTSSISASIQASFGKFDIIHYHAEGPCAMLWLPHLLGKRCIATIHGLDYQRNGRWGRFARAYIKFGEKVAVRCADEIIVLSKAMQKYFMDTYGRTTVFIPNGVNKPELRDADIITKKWGLKKEDYILFLGRIVPEKGANYLIEAYKGLKTDKKLVIAGGYADEERLMTELRQLAGNDDRIIFTDFVQEDILEELYSNAYIYCLPSDLEGMPLSLLEAMSYGNCCVVSDIPECTEVIEDKGVVFKQGNVAELHEKLQNLCDNPDIVTEYKNQSSDFICKKYNWDDVCKKTLALYKRVLV